MNCQNCGHLESDHGPESGRWKDEITGEWSIIIPGRLCFHEENAGHCEDLCDCPMFSTVFDIFAHRGQPLWSHEWSDAYWLAEQNAGGGTAE